MARTNEGSATLLDELASLDELLEEIMDELEELLDEIVEELLPGLLLELPHATSAVESIKRIP
jgi:uncharacterized protein YjgD (DUF1641 family)